MKDRMKNGYLAGRCFGLVWSIFFFVTLDLYSNVKVVPPFTDVGQIYLWDFAAIVIGFSELIGPLFGAVAACASALIDNRLGGSTGRSGVIQLVVSGLLFWIFGYPINSVTLSVSRISTFDVSLLQNFVSPFLGVMFAAFAYYTCQFEKPNPNQVKLHGFLRGFEFFLFAAFGSWAYVSILIPDWVRNMFAGLSVMLVLLLLFAVFARSAICIPFSLDSL
jgi:hypothetical protein